MDVTLDVTREGQRIAWSGTWLVEEHEGHLLVAAPVLYLDQDTTLHLSARVPYAKVFAGATMRVREADRIFVVVHATFDLYTTSHPQISNFAVLLPNPSLPLPPPGAVISKTAAMLRH